MIAYKFEYAFRVYIIWLIFSSVVPDGLDSFVQLG